MDSRLCSALNRRLEWWGVHAFLFRRTSPRVYCSRDVDLETQEAGNLLRGVDGSMRLQIDPHASNPTVLSPEQFVT